MVEVFQSREVFTVNEVATRLKKPVATVRDWVYNRKIPFYKMNGTICFYGRDLNEWFESFYVVPGYQEGSSYRTKIKRVDKKTADNFNEFVENLKKET